MDTSILSPKALFQKDIRYTIPAFQRRYVWTQDDQWEPLWEDVRNTADDYVEKLDLSNGDGVKAEQGTVRHFLGAVVVQQVHTATRDVERREVIDGQQRLTTLQLLLDAVQYVCEDNGIKGVAKRLSKLVINDENLVGNEDEIFKLWPTSNDREAFKHAMHNGLAADDYEYSLIVQAHDLVAWIIPKDALSSCFSIQGITWMPHKFNAARRHKFDKAQYRVINWAEYNESLRQRGDLTIWVSEEAQSVWRAPRRTSRGGQRRYSDLAIETCLTLRTAYRLGLRQTQGLMGSIGTLMGLDIRVPDFSTLSRRANGLSIAQVMRQAGSMPVHLVVDRTGLKIFGEGEWLAQKHKIKGIRRRWRKLHLGLDLASGAIVCADLTHDDVGDSTALPGLLDQLDGPVTGFLADGAYDGASTRNLLRERHGKTLDVVIPPPKNAVIRPQSARDPTVRDRHIAQIRSNGRMAWQAATGYNPRSRIETQIGRWKSVIGPKLKSRSFSRQITEIQVGQKVLNTMTALGRPVFERIA